MNFFNGIKLYPNKTPLYKLKNILLKIHISVPLSFEITALAVMHIHKKEVCSKINTSKQFPSDTESFFA